MIIDVDGRHLSFVAQDSLHRVEGFTIGAVLAALAAALFAVGSVLQHEAAASSTGAGGRLQLRQLLRRPTWVRGQLATVGGTGAQVTALAFAPVSIVQPLIAGELVIALVIRSWRVRRRPTGTEALGAVLVAGGLAVFLSAAQPERGDVEHQPSTASTLGAVLVGLVLVAIASRLGRGRFGAIACGVAAGVSAGLAAVLISAAFKVISRDGFLPALGGPEIWGAVVLAVCSQLGAQQAYSRGALTWSLPTLTLVDPLTAVPAAVVLLGERINPDHAHIWLPAAVVAAVGLVLLARSGPDDHPRPDHHPGPDGTS